MIHSELASSRRGHTLIELVASLAASTVLLAGLGSVMLMARRIAYTPAMSSDRIEAALTANDLADDLRYASYIVDHSEHAVEFVVADRTKDGVEERIRYEWSGDAGDPLVKTINGSDPITVVASLQAFQLDYTIETESTQISSTTETNEYLLLSNASLQSNDTEKITANDWFAQQVDPSDFITPPPSGALYWNATRVEFIAEDSGSQTGTLLVQLRPAGDPDDTPTSYVLDYVTVPESNLNGSAAWYTATLANPMQRLALHRTYALVWQGYGEDNVAELGVDDKSAKGILETYDAGATWTYDPTRQIYYRLYGTYTVPQSDHEVTRRYVSAVAVSMQAGADSSSRVDSSVALHNSPELLSEFWHTDFDTDPTASDLNGDGTSDWAMIDGSTFNTDTIDDGIWYAIGSLVSQPLSDFSEITTLDMSFRIAPGGSLGYVQLNADWDGGMGAILYAWLVRQSDGLQTAFIYAKDFGGSTIELLQLSDLPDDYVRFQLTVFPDSDLVNIQVNGVDVGTYEYPLTPVSSDNRRLTVAGTTGLELFDYVQLRVSESD